VGRVGGSLETAAMARVGGGSAETGVAWGVEPSGGRGVCMTGRAHKVVSSEHELR
jgi:hypothetical protein